MRITINKFLPIVLVACTSLINISCKKSNDAIAPYLYTSLQDFHAKNGVAKIKYTINAATGGTFTTVQGTVVTVPANNFINASGSTVSGMVVIEFADIYKKSDMLLSDIPTVFLGMPLESAGEFFIRATLNDSALQIKEQAIKVMQPLNGQVMDGMLPFLGAVNQQNQFGWMLPKDSNRISADLYSNVTNYVFSLYTFHTPIDSGTWCNSDNPYYFGGYPQTILTLHSNSDPAILPEVYLVFKNENSMVHVYQAFTGANDFPYNFAPMGLECTIVVIAVDKGKILSSFTPITITANSTVNFTLTETTEEAFKAKLVSLN